MIICLIAFLAGSFIINPGWTVSLTKEFVAYIKGNWSEFRNSKKED